MGALSLFSKLLQTAGRARGMGAGFAGRAPRNFSPLGQAASSAPPVGRAAVSSDPLKSLVGDLPNMFRAPARSSGTLSGATRGGGGMKLMGRAGLAELGLIGADAAGRALNEDYARNRGIQDAYEAKFGKNYSISVKEMADELAKTGDIDPLTLREFYGGSGDMDAGPGGPSSLSERTAPAVLNGIGGIVDVDPKTGKGLPGTWRRGDNDADDAATYNAGTGEYTFKSDVAPSAPQLPAPPKDLPPSPEQVQVMDPFAYNLSVYGQGRQAAQSQEAQAKVRDLGLAIHKAKYPQFYQESYNPLMAATFPERYTKTPQDFVVEGGIQAPRGMITKDDEQAIIDANGGEVFTSLDQPTSVVEELLRQAAAKKKGG